MWRGLRIGVPRGRLFHTDRGKWSRSAFETNPARLERAGARIVDIDIEDLLEAMGELMADAPLVAIEAAAVHADHLGFDDKLFDPLVITRIRMGATVPAAGYIRLMRARDALIARMDARLAAWDVVALPATATSALPIAELEADFERYMKANVLILRNTTWGNQFDLTGISLPMPGLARPAGIPCSSRAHGPSRTRGSARSPAGHRTGPSCAA